MNQLQRYFEPIVRKQRAKNRIAGVALFVGGLTAAAWAFSQDYTAYAIGRLGTVALIGAPVGLIVFVLSFRVHKGLAALSDPARIVWYYGVMKTGHVNAVMIGLDDGRLVRLLLPLISLREGFSQEAFQILGETAPHACNDYSEELRLAFRRDPSSLKGSRSSSSKPGLAGGELSGA